MKIPKNIRLWYMLPGYCVILFVFVYPIIMLFRYSFFNKIDGNLIFMGLKNFSKLFADPIFYTSLKNNFLFLLIVPILLGISIVISFKLYEGFFGWKIYRAVIFFPYILAIAVVGVIFVYLFSGNGPINSFLINKAIISKPIEFFASAKIAKWVLMGVIIWKEVGFGIILFLARLLSVDEQLFEAAELDGANWLQKVRHIAIPQLSTVIEFYTIFSTITVFSWVFTYVYSTTNGGPNNSTYVMEFYIYKIAFRYNIPEVASSASLILLVLVSLIIYIQFRVRRKIEVE